MEQFKKYLEDMDFSDRTITAYMYAVRKYYDRYNIVNEQNLRDYKFYLIHRFMPTSVNMHLQALKKYLAYKGLDYHLKTVKIQSHVHTNIISNDEYVYLKSKLRHENNKMWYFAVCFMAQTGVRVGELVNITMENVYAGSFEIYSKGLKARHVFIPKQLQIECMRWLRKKNYNSGYIFLNRYGSKISTRGIAMGLKRYAKKYGMDKSNVFPHSFRHRFAMNFLKFNNDIVLLADLLGHSNLETTRVYLRHSLREIKSIVDDVVKW